MNKSVKFIIAVCGVLTMVSCGSNDPYKKGVAAGKAACECYKMEGLEAVEQCIAKIERENQEFLNDSIYISACEEQMLNCITQGVIDADKPIKEAPVKKMESEEPTEAETQE
jgi:hypothetical protein